MGLFDQVRKLLGTRSPSSRDMILPGFPPMPTSESLPRDGEASAIFAEIVAQAIAAGENWRIKLSGSDRYNQLKSEPEALQLAVIEVAAAGVPERGSRSFAGDAWKVKEVRKALVSQLLRRKIEVPPALQARLLNLWIKTSYALEYSDVSGLAVLGAVERHAQKHGLPQEVRPILRKIEHTLTADRPRGQNPTKWAQGVIDRIAALLDPQAVADRPPLPSGGFADAFLEWVESMDGALRDKWLALAAHCATAGDKSAPAKKWLSEGEELVDAMGREEFANGLLSWFRVTKLDPSHPDFSLDILKGMIWLAPLLVDDEIAAGTGRFAETCFRKVPNYGARSVKLGNATLYALSEMAGAQAAGAELFRLSGVIKYPSARKLLDKRIAELADASGSDVAALEDAALPDHGIGADGTMRTDFGAAHALLTVSATGTEVVWYADAEKQVKNPPAAVKAEYKEALAAFKLAAKDIEKARAAQAKRLEAGWLEARSWSLADWRTHYCGHNLRRPLVEALIWQVAPADGAPVAVMPGAGELRDVAGAPVSIPDDARVSLWHPLQADPEQVLAWRQRILDLGLVQPIKQAHREIYVLTDAERSTGSYSNRFAAHILRQHQFRALCQARDWKYDFMGGWDSYNVPTRSLPHLGLAVEYSVEAVEDGQRSGAYVPLHIATDQVRFIDTHARQQLDLVQVDPVVFSELMRDVDLFVAVTSVANDPAWTDGGPDGRFGTYWREWAFGELGQSAETRKELIAQIAPKLSIADRLEIGDKALIVTGKRHKYAIHFGSANIQILPANRYLCIVPDRGPREAERIHLPFVGDNQLSTILAKTFMLVDEDKITDRTILTQLR